MRHRKYLGYIMTKDLLEKLRLTGYIDGKRNMRRVFPMLDRWQNTDKCHERWNFFESHDCARSEWVSAYIRKKKRNTTMIQPVKMKWNKDN